MFIHASHLLAHMLVSLSSSIFIHYSENVNNCVSEVRFLKVFFDE